MNKEKGGTGTFLAGLLVGGLAGALITLLNAPRPGEETREQLRNRGIELRDTAEQKVEEYLTQGRAVLAESQKQWAKASEEIKQIASEAIGEIQRVTAEAGEESREAVKETVEELQKTVSETR